MRALLLFVFTLSFLSVAAQKSRLYLRSTESGKVIRLKDEWDFTLHTRSDTVNGALAGCTDSTITLHRRQYTGMAWDHKKSKMVYAFRDTLITFSYGEIQGFRMVKLKDGAEGILFMAPLTAAAFVGGAVTLLTQQGMDERIAGAVILSAGTFMLVKTWLYLRRSKGVTYATSRWKPVAAKSRREAKRK